MELSLAMYWTKQCLTSCTLYKLTVTCGLTKPIIKSCQNWGIGTSKIICTVKLLISQWAVVWPTYFTSCQNSFTCLHHGHLGSLCGKQTSQASSSSYMNNNVVCPCHALPLAVPWLCHTKKLDTKNPSVYTCWSRISFTDPQLPLSHPGHCGDQAYCSCVLLCSL